MYRYLSYTGYDICFKFVAVPILQEMLERQLEYERVRLEAESRKATLESQEKVTFIIIIITLFVYMYVCVLY